jgi:23S rRNA (adenine2503-C2)-methyltransferase
MADGKKLFILDLTLPELRELLNSWGQPDFRAIQIWQGLYKQLWRSPDEFTILPVELRQRMQNELAFLSIISGQILQSSDQETVKTLFHLPEGNAIETVLMTYDVRRTLCISTQAGCAMGCVFCATGQMGFKRNLTSGEIIEQVLYYARQLKSEGEHVTNVVFMGMGEPFHNFQATMDAIDRLNDPQGFRLGERRFTISTVGLTPMIQKFSDEKRQINLAISLHAANDELRSSLLPVNHKYPIGELIAACRYYIKKTNRRITFEWALIQGINDSENDAKELAELLKGLICHVNVIPLNPTKKFFGKATTPQRAEAFQAVLDQAGIPCTIRLRRGIDITAGCGQLATNASQE